MMDGTSQVIGQPLDRTDGPLKVTDGARYAAEFRLAGLCHAVMVLSTVPRGRIVNLDTTRAERAPGVVFVLSHRNAPSLPDHGRAAFKPPAGRAMSLFQDDEVHYNRQPIAVVVANTFEQAVAAAMLVDAHYTLQSPALAFDAELQHAYKPKEAGQKPPDVSWGDIDLGERGAEVRVDATYTTPMQNHNPIEPHATIAHWEGSRLTLYDAICLRRSHDRVENAGNSGRRRARHFSLCRRRLRLQGFRLVARHPGGDVREGGAAAGEARRRSPADVRSGGGPTADLPACPARRTPRWRADLRSSRRGFAHVGIRGLRGAVGRRVAHDVRRSQRDDDAPPAQAQHRHADVPARAGRGHRELRARIRDGRARGGAADGSARASAAQLRRERG